MKRQLVTLISLPSRHRTLTATARMKSQDDEDIVQSSPLPKAFREPTNIISALEATKPPENEREATLVRAAQPYRAKEFKASTTTDQDECSDSDYDPFSHELKPAFLYNQRKSVPKRSVVLLS